MSAGTPASQQAAAVVVAILELARHSIETQQDELGRLDAVAGDGDHGIGMLRGVTAALAAAQTARAAHAGAGTVLMAAGDAWADRAGGTSGALWGVILCNLGSALGDTFRPDATLVAAGVASALQAVMKVGRAQSGDKTLVDVLQPFSTALAQGAVDGLERCANLGTWRGYRRACRTGNPRFTSQNRSRTSARGKKYRHARSGCGINGVNRRCRRPGDL